MTHSCASIEATCNTVDRFDSFFWLSVNLWVAWVATKYNAVCNDVAIFFSHLYRFNWRHQTESRQTGQWWRSLHILGIPYYWQFADVLRVAYNFLCRSGKAQEFSNKTKAADSTWWRKSSGWILRASSPAILSRSFAGGKPICEFGNCFTYVEADITRHMREEWEYMILNLRKQSRLWHGRIRYLVFFSWGKVRK